MRAFLFACACLAASSPALGGVVYEVELVNTSQSGIVSLEVAKSGSDRFHRVNFSKAPREGGGESAVARIRLGDDGCRRDLRIGLADGHFVMQNGLNVCEFQSDRATQSRQANATSMKVPLRG